jgi:hypothetical protein
MALSTCSMASVVTASFLSFQLLKLFYFIPITVSVSPVLFVNFFGGVAVMPHKYIFSIKGIGSSEYRTNIM